MNDSHGRGKDQGSTSVETHSPPTKDPESTGRTSVVPPGAQRKSSIYRSDRRLGWYMIAPAILVTFLVLVYPMFVAIRQSFYNIDTVTRQTTFAGLANYTRLLGDEQFWASLWRTIYWVVGAMGSQVVVGILVAIALNKAVRGRTHLRGLVLFPYLVPAIVAVLVWRWLFSDTVGLANYVFVDLLSLSDSPIPWFSPDWAMISVLIITLWKYVPYWALFVLARLQTIPPDLYESAAIDGASGWQRFRHITWPWILPVVMVLLILRSIWAFREFDMVFLPAGGGPLFHTTTIAVYIRHLAFDVLDIGQAAAVAMALLIMVGALTQFYFRIYDRSETKLD